MKEKSCAVYRRRCPCSLYFVDGFCPKRCDLYRLPRGKTKEQINRELRAGERVGVQRGLETQVGRPV